MITVEGRRTIIDGQMGDHDHCYFAHWVALLKVSYRDQIRTSRSVLMRWTTGTLLGGRLPYSVMTISIY